MRYGVYDIVISLVSNQSEMSHFVDIIFIGFYIRPQVTLKKTGKYFGSKKNKFLYKPSK